MKWVRDFNPNTTVLLVYPHFSFSSESSRRYKYSLLSYWVFIVLMSLKFTEAAARLEAVSQ